MASPMSHNPMDYNGMKLVREGAQRLFQRFAGQANVAPENDSFRLQVLALGATDAPGNVFI